MFLNWHSISISKKRIIVGICAVLIYAVSHRLMVTGISLYPGSLFTMFLFPALVILPRPLITLLGNFGLAVYFHLIFGLIAASFVGLTNRLAINIRNLVVGSLALFTVIFFFGAMIMGPGP